MPAYSPGDGDADAVTVTGTAMSRAAERAIDGVVSVGGGSTIRLGKAIAPHTDLPQIVIATTYAGSKVTPILGETWKGAKTTQSTHKPLPEVISSRRPIPIPLPPTSSRPIVNIRPKTPCSVSSIRQSPVSARSTIRQSPSATAFGSLLGGRLEFRHRSQRGCRRTGEPKRPAKRAASNSGIRQEAVVLPLSAAGRDFC